MGEPFSLTGNEKVKDLSKALSEQADGETNISYFFGFLSYYNFFSFCQAI